MFNCSITQYITFKEIARLHQLIIRKGLYKYTNKYICDLYD
jgi:hypothetical protein